MNKKSSIGALKICCTCFYELMSFIFKYMLVKWTPGRLVDVNRQPIEMDYYILRRKRGWEHLFTLNSSLLPNPPLFPLISRDDQTTEFQSISILSPTFQSIHFFFLFFILKGWGKMRKEANILFYSHFTPDLPVYSFLFFYRFFILKDRE
jgi:hypothetical protein